MRNNLFNNPRTLLASARLAIRILPSLLALSTANLALANPSVSEASDRPFAVKVDARGVMPLLNVMIMQDAERPADSQVTLQAYSNYAAFISRGEIRIFATGQSVDAVPYKILPLDANNQATFIADQADPAAMFYVLRVYDQAGRFDETRPAEWITAKASATLPEPTEPPVLFGRDNSARRAIMLRGGAVTVTGTTSSRTHKVHVLGQPVPVDEHGQFVGQQILPFGRQQLAVSIYENGALIASHDQQLDIPRNEWFTVAIGDITIGDKGVVSGAALGTGADPELDKLYTNTRGAFYSKGPLDRRTTLTAALDTGESAFKHIFSNLNDKDPAQLLRRLDPSLYYPTYGDDSSTVEDAPSQGRFYLRVDRDASKLVVGNFVVDTNSTELAQLDRGLYGALGDYASVATTSFGERKTQVTAFASDPGTVPAREEFRGTGGSIYYLQRQDIAIGSERLRIEIRDRDSGLVLDSQELQPQADYDIDYIQGRLFLTQPLSSTANAGDIVRNGTNPRHLAVLLVRYEYTPTLSDLSGYTLGGRASQWLGEAVRLGATAQREATSTADQTLVGTDLLLRKSEQTYLKAEIARSKGPAFDQLNSSDGGLNFFTLSNPGRPQPALAWRSEAALAFAELSGQVDGPDRGTISAYIEQLDAAYAGVGRLAGDAIKRWGGKLAFPLDPTFALEADFDAINSRVVGRNRSLDLGLTKTIGLWHGKLGWRHEQRQANSFLSNYDVSGTRNDLATQIGYDAPNGWGVYGFAQASVQRAATREDNSRGGLGGRYELSDRFTANAELSGGAGGFGANVGLTRKQGANAETYLNYAIASSRPADSSFEAQSLSTRAHNGALTLGSRMLVGKNLSVRGEERYATAPGARDLTHSYGLDYTPGEAWSLNATIERGEVRDSQSGSFQRTAATGSIGYSHAGLRFASALEARFEEGVGRQQTSWLSRTTVGLELDPAWRALGRFNLALTDAEQDSLRDAGFVEAVAGLAYRPLVDNRLNALFKYTYFKDTAAYEQISRGTDNAAPKQISQILSADVSYDLTPGLAIGAKYGFRAGKVALERGSDTYVSSEAHLGVVRADLNIFKKWALLLESRILLTPKLDQRRVGGLFGLSYDLGNHVRIGVGYSLSRFSDDLTDQSDSSRGLFVNLVGKF
jgi:hypothetical protein